MAIGQTFVLIIAGIDLSQGAVISLTSVVGAAFIATTVDPVVFAKSPLWGVLLFENGALLARFACRHPGGHRWPCWWWACWSACSTALAVAFARIPPFMVTLVTSMFCGALAIFLVKSENIINLPTRVHGHRR